MLRNQEPAIITPSPLLLLRARPQTARAAFICWKHIVTQNRRQISDDNTTGSWRDAFDSSPNPRTLSLLRFESSHDNIYKQERLSEIKQCFERLSYIFHKEDMI